MVMPITTSSWMMLQRNLRHTTVTRAKRLVVFGGSTKAIGQAVRVAGAGRRHTALDHRLAERSAQPAIPVRAAKSLSLPTNPIAVSSVQLSPRGDTVTGLVGSRSPRRGLRRPRYWDATRS